MTGPQLHLDFSPDAPAIVHVRGEGLVPIDVNRALRQDLTVPLLLLPGVVDPITLIVDGRPQSIGVNGRGVPRMMVDAPRHAALTAWRPGSATAERRRFVLWLAVALATTLLLARLAPRRAGLAVVAVAAGWAIALGIAIGRRQTLFIDDESGTRWVATLAPKTLRIPIREDVPWVPIVESMAHARTMEARIVVGDGGAALEVKLSADGKLMLTTPP